VKAMACVLRIRGSEAKAITVVITTVMGPVGSEIKVECPSETGAAMNPPAPPPTDRKPAPARTRHPKANAIGQGNHRSRLTPPKQITL